MNDNSNRMNVLFFIPESEQGGGQVYIYSLARELKKQNISVSIGTGSQGWLSSRAAEDGIQTVIFRYGRRSFFPATIFLFIREFRSYLKSYSIDIVHLHGSNALFGVLSTLFIRKKPKIVFTWGGLSFLHPEWKENQFIKIIGYLVFRLLLPLIDRSLFVCKADYEYVKKIRLLGKKQETQCSVIYNGVDENISFIPKKEARIFLETRVHATFHDNFVIGSIARFEYQKNIAMFIDIARQIGEMRHGLTYCVIGYGTLLNDLANKIRTLGFEDTFFLIPGFSDAFRYLKAFDIFVLTSRYEGLPFALLEARLAGIPTVSTAVGGIPEMVRDGHDGFFVHPNNQNAFKQRLLQLVNDESLRTNFAQEGKKDIRNRFTSRAMISETYLQYKDLFRIQ